jgi:uncharacterized protein YqeY
MELKEKINKKLIEAMKSGDNLTKTTLRGVMAGIKQFEIDKRIDIKDTDVLSILQKEMKSRKESISDAQKAERSDLITEYEAQAKVIELFLPPPMSEEELTKIIEAAVQESGASSPADMGKVMQLVMPQVKGKADGKKVNEIVRSKLNK